MALEMKTACERCGIALPADSTNATICSYECTWCAACATDMDHTCPNCRGQLQPRPTRIEDHA